MTNKMNILKYMNLYSKTKNFTDDVSKQNESSAL